ncbi:MAG: rhomboid family intramembrane serine protease [Acetobacteraceae bacterium]|jgi:rhomboid protease GluP|nr:rhomboid family intramembrane serine protease [Acetobacteraceae bacterium]
MSGPYPRDEQQSWQPPEHEAISPAPEDPEEKEIVRYVDQLLARHPRIHIVPALILLNIVITLTFCAINGGWLLPDGKALIPWGSNYGPLSLQGEWWRLASAIFLHAGVLHLFVNIYTLWSFGGLCERMFGPSLFLVIYMTGGICASGFSLLWNPLVNSVGASGAICAVIGASLAYMLDERNEVPFSVLREEGRSLGAFMIFSLIAVIQNAPLDHAAHFGGLISGFLIGGAMSAVATERSIRHHLRMALIALAIMLTTAALYAAGRARLAHETGATIRQDQSPD